MKKTIIAVLCVSLLFSLFSCDNSTKSVNDAVAFTNNAIYLDSLTTGNVPIV